MRDLEEIREARPKAAEEYADTRVPPAAYPDLPLWLVQAWHRVAFLVGAESNDADIAERDGEIARLRAIRKSFEFYGTTGCAECEEGSVTLFISNAKCLTCDPQNYDLDHAKWSRGKIADLEARLAEKEERLKVAEAALVNCARDSFPKQNAREALARLREP